MKTYDEMKAEFELTLQVEQHLWRNRDMKDSAESWELISRWNLLTELAGRLFGEATAAEMIQASMK